MERGVNHELNPRQTNSVGGEARISASVVTMHDPPQVNKANTLAGLSALLRPQPSSLIEHDGLDHLDSSLNEKRPTVLIADDNDDTRQMFQVLLGAKGYRVIQASDGEQAVDVIQHEDPGLVLLDLGLPRLNGLRVIHRLRDDLGLTAVPLIVITGYDDQFETAVAAGCDDYLLKPIDFGRLEAILDYYVPMTKAQAAAPG